MLELTRRECRLIRRGLDQMGEDIKLRAPGISQRELNRVKAKVIAHENSLPREAGIEQPHGEVCKEPYKEDPWAGWGQTVKHS